MALITGCNTGKHPAAPLPDTKACHRCRRGCSHAAASAPCVLRIDTNAVQTWTVSRSRYDLDVWFPNPITSGIPVVWREPPGETARKGWLAVTEHRKLLYSPGKITNMQQKSHCSGIKLWSKYRRRVTVSLWPRTHRMGDTLQCTANADAEEEQSRHY